MFSLSDAVSAAAKPAASSTKERKPHLATATSKSRTRIDHGYDTDEELFQLREVVRREPSVTVSTSPHTLYCN